MGIKLSAKFARQESEQARVARIARKRVPPDRADTIRRMLGILEPQPHREERSVDAVGSLSCPRCHRAFALPMLCLLKTRPPRLSCGLRNDPLLARHGHLALDRPWDTPVGGAHA